MFDPSRIRFTVLGARQRHCGDRAATDKNLATLLAEAMIDLRRQRGEATRDALRYCGFTDDELDRLSDRALNAAATAWHGNHYFEPAA